MIELIKLIDTKFFPEITESKQELNEASGLNGGSS